MIKTHKRAWIAISACLVIGLLLWIDAISTRSRNGADKERLAQVRLGMDEDAVVALMGRKPIKIPGEPYHSYICVGERESVFRAIISPNEPTISVTGRIKIPTEWALQNP